MYASQISIQMQAAAKSGDEEGGDEFDDFIKSFISSDDVWTSDRAGAPEEV